MSEKVWRGADVTQTIATYICIPCLILALPMALICLAIYACCWYVKVYIDDNHGDAE